MARTVDHISDGRLILGIGAGWAERDYEEYGYDFERAGRRLAALGDALPRITTRWSKLNPAPTSDIPILVGGGGEKKTLRIVAEHATIWHCFGDLETLSHKNAVLDQWCADQGRDPGEIERSAAAEAGPDELGEGLTELGTRLVTTHVDGRAGFDLALTRDWMQFRDEFNAHNPS